MGLLSHIKSLASALERTFAHLGLSDSTGYFLRSELRLMLRKRLLLVPSGAVVLEIGTFEGLAAIYFAKSFASQVHTVDPFDAADPGTPLTKSTEKNFRGNRRKSRLGSKIHHYRMTSDDFFARVRSPQFDLIYIDGSHDPAVLARDLRNSLSRLKEGGILWVDDYGSDYRVRGKSLTRVVDDFHARNTHRLDQIHVGYQVGFRVRIADPVANEPLPARR